MLLVGFVNGSKGWLPTGFELSQHLTVVKDIGQLNWESAGLLSGRWPVQNNCEENAAVVMTSANALGFLVFSDKEEKL